MSRAALISVVLLLGLGDVALAQPRAIVAPAPRSADVTSSWFEGPSPTAPIEPLTWDVPPVTSGLGGQDERTRRLPPSLPVDAVPQVASGLDPEPKSAPSVRPSSKPRVATWSARCNEIVEPWQRMPKLGTIAVANLIVDPWAPSVQRAQGKQP